MGEIAYVNGALVHVSQAKVSIMDRGFAYGDGLFETLRVYKGVPFLLEEHLARLTASAKELSVPVSPAGELESAIASLIDANTIKEGVLKIVLTRGVGGRGLSYPADIKPTLVITLTKGVPYPEDVYLRGWSATFVPDNRSFGNLKSLNFLANVLAKAAADKGGADEAFYVKNGRVLEGAMSTIFAVRGSCLMTPPLDHEILAGITRAHILDLAKKHGISAKEAPLAKENLLTADEVFITNSVLELMPIVSIENKPVATGKSGAISVLLRKKYQESVQSHVDQRTSDS